MLLYLSRKLAGALAVLLLLSALIFFAGRGLVPGNLATVLAGPKASPETIKAIERDLGLDQPIYQQYLDWLSGVLRGDLGTSPFSGQPNLDVIAQQVPVSLELSLMGLFFAVLIGIPIGVIAANRAGSGTDWGIRLPLLIVFAFPAFVSGSAALYLATHYLTNLYSPSYIPFSDSAMANLQTMLLPALAVGIPTAPLVSQMTRSSMIEVLSQPYIATARTNGIAEWRITYLYALRAALPPVLTLIGFIFGLLVGGLFIVEQIFSLPGLGRGVLSSISNRDFSQVTAQAIVMAGAFILGNLLVDLALPFVDRRILRK
ncbi:ABC transporter permease [Sinosporangium siamense]|uniref:ABC di/oligopeptide transporter inner membrane subunit n=1 Tax=Sinosporangium siamense TaxID=1367973 RepID=A0A919VA08_9ACTN|nr:ABC transporter permease [Sinosporangium siamense]GII95926.1 ABC di/oligopeptide transporter inner membrane subunit [Sinosporangium siamense]